jgi:3-oxo-5-alpha-steroid 4-dehydrogenase 1
MVGSMNLIVDRFLFFYLLGGWIGLSFIIFLILRFIPAPYGRYLKKGWGTHLPSRLGWVVMESVSLFGIVALFLLGRRVDNKAALIFVLMWISHYSYRAVFFPLTRKTEKKHIPLLVVFCAIIFNCFNCFFNGYYLFFIAPLYPVQWLTDFRFIFGLTLFIIGFLIHVYSDHILNSLRDSTNKGYKIPLGGLFDWVSCPNYLGEIIEWTGWAIATWSVAGFSFALWTVANLAPRALSHHAWYRSTFKNYPSKRRALIPFLL